MSTIQGRLIDVNTKQPLSIGSIPILVYATGDQSKDPVATFYTDDNGSYSITSTVFDQYPNASVSVGPDGYGEVVGPAGFFSGDVDMYPSSITNTISKIPVWAWVAIGLVAAFLVWKYILKGKKLL